MRQLDLFNNNLNLNEDEKNLILTFVNMNYKKFLINNSLDDTNPLLYSFSNEKYVNIFLETLSNMVGYPATNENKKDTDANIVNLLYNFKDELPENTIENFYLKKSLLVKALNLTDTDHYMIKKNHSLYRNNNEYCEKIINTIGTKKKSNSFFSNEYQSLVSKEEKENNKILIKNEFIEIYKNKIDCFNKNKELEINEKNIDNIIENILLLIKCLDKMLYLTNCYYEDYENNDEYYSTYLQNEYKNYQVLFSKDEFKDLVGLINNLFDKDYLNKINKIKTEIYEKREESNYFYKIVTNKLNIDNAIFDFLQKVMKSKVMNYDEKVLLFKEFNYDDYTHLYDESILKNLIFNPIDFFTEDALKNVNTMKSIIKNKNSYLKCITYTEGYKNAIGLKIAAQFLNILERDYKIGKEIIDFFLSDEEVKNHFLDKSTSKFEELNNIDFFFKFCEIKSRTTVSMESAYKNVCNLKSLYERDLLTKQLEQEIKVNQPKEKKVRKL